MLRISKCNNYQNLHDIQDFYKPSKLEKKKKEKSFYNDIFHASLPPFFFFIIQMISLHIILLIIFQDTSLTFLTLKIQKEK